MLRSVKTQFLQKNLLIFSSRCAVCNVYYLIYVFCNATTRAAEQCIHVQSIVFVIHKRLHMYNDFFYKRKANNCSPKHTRYSSDGYITLILDKENISMAYVWNGWCINYQHNKFRFASLYFHHVIFIHVLTNMFKCLEDQASSIKSSTDQILKMKIYIYSQ